VGFLFIVMTKKTKALGWIPKRKLLEYKKSVEKVIGYKMVKFKVLTQNITTVKYNKEDYILLTDIANAKDSEQRAADIIKNWIRNRGTLEFIGTWEVLYNPDFKVVEFDHFKTQAGLQSFVLSPGKWIESTSAVGIVVKGRYGGTYVHKDIAFEFASAINPIFKIYLIKEFQRLKDMELQQLGWDIKRNLTKINYRIHTGVIKENLIPKELTSAQILFVYASEADILNVALFGQTAKQWKEANPTLRANMRDYADVNQLICLANLESLNSHFISEQIPSNERIIKLNKIAKQMIQENNSESNTQNLTSNLAPIVLFVYNSPWHTRQTVEVLQKNHLASESEFFIYSDAPKNENAVDKVSEVREYIKSITGFKKVTVIKREKNWGLADSIIDGVIKIVNEYGKIIVLEDDLVTSPYFLRFMNEALEIYKDEEKVAWNSPIVDWMKGDLREFFGDIVNSKSFNQSHLVQNQIDIKQRFENLNSSNESKMSDGVKICNDVYPYLWEESIIKGKCFE
jgi:hypothetical protein